MTDEELIEWLEKKWCESSQNPDWLRIIKLARLGLAKVPPKDSVEVKIAVATTDKHVHMLYCGDYELPEAALQDVLAWVEDSVTHAAIVTAHIPRIQVNQVDGEAS